MALRMQPTQLRIADLVARAPSNLPDDFEPEVAHITNATIRITQAYNFAKTHTFVKEKGGWKVNE
jgi:septum site-determining protein MinC